MHLGEVTLYDDINKRVKRVARKLNKQPALVILQWQLQHGMGVIPRATQRVNLLNNLEGLAGWELSKVDMDLLNQSDLAGEEDPKTNSKGSDMDDEPSAGLIPEEPEL